MAICKNSSTLAPLTLPLTLFEPARPL